MRNIPARIHTLLSACVVLFAASAQGIRVKFGTNDGPIIPPTPEPRIIPEKPYRIPAPVWEDRTGDLPDPNANWNLFISNSALYTTYQPTPAYYQPLAPQQSNARRFVQAYLPTKKPNHPGPYFKPAYEETARNSHSVPVVANAPQYQTTRPVPQSTRYTQVTPVADSQQGPQGVPAVPHSRHFVPIYVKEQQKLQDHARQEDAAQNQIDNNEVDGDSSGNAHDIALKYEKEARRTVRSSSEGSQNAYVYTNLPVFISHRPPFYYGH